MKNDGGPAMEKVIKYVISERKRQDEKWGANRTHHPLEWLAILGEEVGEANQAALEAHFSGYDRSGNWDDYRKELVQVAAVAVAMIESHDNAMLKAREENHPDNDISPYDPERHNQ